MLESIKNVIVIGASGNLGAPIVSALVAQSYTVTALTRDTSTSTFPLAVSVYRTNYTPTSLLAAFTGQDAVVCAIAISALSEQKTIIEAAVQAGVKRFIPAEFGCDTAPENASQIVPPLAMKQDIISYLKSTAKPGGLTWTAICCGMFFDWSIANNHMQFNVPARHYTVFADGNHPFIGTTLGQIARCVPAVLSPAHLAETANRYIYISSFSGQGALTQNVVLESLERACSSPFTVTRSTVDALAASGMAKMGKGLVMEGLVEMINASMYGYGGLNEFSKEAEVWNKKLGLSDEDLDQVVQEVVSKMGSLAG